MRLAMLRSISAGLDSLDIIAWHCMLVVFQQLFSHSRHVQEQVGKYLDQLGWCSWGNIMSVFIPSLANATSMVRTTMRSLQCWHLMVDLTALFKSVALSSMTMIAELSLGKFFKASSMISQSDLNSPRPNTSIWHPSVKLEGSLDSAQSLAFNPSWVAFPIVFAKI